MSKTKTKYKKGEIVMVNLGKIRTSAIVGHEQGETRPCIVIKSLHSHGLMTIVPFTSSKPKTIQYFHVKVEKDGTVLTTDSYALCHQIRTISVGRVIDSRGHLKKIDREKVLVVLGDYLGLD